MKLAWSFMTTMVPDQLFAQLRVKNRQKATVITFTRAHKFLCHSNKLPAAFGGYFVPNSAIHSYSTRSSSDLHLLSPQTAVGKKN